MFRLRSAHCNSRRAILCIAQAAGLFVLRADDRLRAMEPAAPARTAEIETAVRTGLDLVLRAGGNWTRNAECFSCHNQTLPLFALRQGERAGLRADAEWVQAQSDFTHAHFHRLIPRLLGDKHIGGGAFTATYGLWTFHLADRPSDETTDALVAYLLRIQGVARPEDLQPERSDRLRDGPWLASCRRPPLQMSEVAATVLALEGLERYASEEQRPRVVAARNKAEAWLATAPLESQEDLVWRLWGLHYLGGDETVLQDVRARLITAQREDGGWSQEADLSSDAYSTGQALFVLRLTGSTTDDPVVVQAVDYLLKTRCEDGSWLVETRAKPVQKYFDNGDPHGKHQFLSTAATAWATAGLIGMLPANEATAAQ